MNIFLYIKTPTGKAIQLFGLWLCGTGNAMEGYFHPSSTVMHLTHNTIHLKTKNRTIFLNAVDKVCGRKVEQDIPIGPKEEIITAVGKFIVQPAQRVHTRKRFIAPVPDTNNFYFIHEYPNPLKSSYDPKKWAVMADSAVDATVRLYENDQMLHDLGKSLAKSLSGDLQ